MMGWVLHVCHYRKIPSYLIFIFTLTPSLDKVWNQNSGFSGGEWSAPIIQRTKM